MSQMVEIECPTCRHKWWIDYQQLQSYKVIYRGDKRDKVERQEEYRLRCPNPAHGDYVIVSGELTDSDE